MTASVRTRGTKPAGPVTGLVAPTGVYWSDIVKLTLCDAYTTIRGAMTEETATVLANIERVDLKIVWPSEPSAFTPWLADNISALGTALGLELEVRQLEAEVGDFYLDVLASDLNGNRPVVIENQLEATDHDHLGKLLTYAAGFDANVVVWLTREFRDEHRQALDWLNQRTGEDTLFFGVVVELWRIENSRPAPHFNLVAAPNDWRKERIVRPPPRPSEKGERYRAFFQTLIDTLRERHQFTKGKRGQPQNWYTFVSGDRRFRYGANFTAAGNARVEIYIDSGDENENRAFFESLETSKVEIETELGHALDWQPLAGKRAFRIATDRPGTINDSDTDLDEIRDWMVKELLAFKRVFSNAVASSVP